MSCSFFHLKVMYALELLRGILHTDFVNKTTAKKYGKSKLKKNLN